ncbi:toll/interleukin-1 receptor domain-containing protein [Leptothoe sp. LEGE 181152]|nr:toll/interleukin-1 receptor domain-containing protein [Leptothoe sp. LEGE 181152]
MKDKLLFSELYGISVSDDDDWFDLRLDRDTHLCIDPCLVFKSKESRFRSCKNKFMRFFEAAFNKASEIEKVPSEADKKTENFPPNYKSLIYEILLFPEVEEVCLGFSKRDTKGAGMAIDFAMKLANALIRRSKRTNSPPKHFEEIEIFTPGIGKDKISDATANLIKRELVEYTLDICRNLNIPTKLLQVKNIDFDFDEYEWDHQLINLPFNPFNKKSIILVPKAFLRKIPSISSKEFYGYIESRSNKQLRANLNAKIHNNLENHQLEQKSKAKRKKEKYRKGKIIEYASQNPDKVSEYINFVENSEKEYIPYDLKKDDDNLYGFPRTISKFIYGNPIQTISCNTEEELSTSLDKIFLQLKLFVEEHDGYKLLWKQEDEKSTVSEKQSFIFRYEADAQDLFRIFIGEYCAINNIKIKEERSLGVNPVEFRTRSYRNKIWLITKLFRNISFDRSELIELISELKKKGIKYCYYTVFIHTKEDFKKAINILEEVNLFDFREILFKVNFINVMLDRKMNLSFQEPKDLNPRNEVYISYARNGASGQVADKIFEMIKDENINIIRDSEELRYKDSLKSFMRRIGQGKCIVAIISRDYLRSRYCMFELNEIANNRKVKERIVPIIFEDSNIYDPIAILEYVEYWEEKARELKEKIKTVDIANTIGIRDDIDLYSMTCRNISQLINILRDFIVQPVTIELDSGQLDSTFEDVIYEVKKILS